MAKPEWGTKRICPNCGTRYYDMRKDPPTCPSCSTVFDPEALLKSRRARPIPVEDTKKVAPTRERDDDETLGVDTEEERVDDDEAETDVEADEDVDVVVEDEDADPVDEDEDVLLEDADELGDDEELEVGGDVDSDEDR